MQLTPQITLRDIPDSVAVEDKILQKVKKLNLYCDHIMSCRVVVEFVRKHQHQGKLYTVHIDLKVPGKEFAVTKVFNEDLYVAIRDAFDAAARQLEDYVRRERGDVKTHVSHQRGRIARLFDDYGFIHTADGTEYYFHASQLLTPDFAKLTIGNEVEFVEMVGSDGLHATQISIISIE